MGVLRYVVDGIPVAYQQSSRLSVDDKHEEMPFTAQTPTRQTENT